MRTRSWTAYSFIADALRREIINGDLAPGEKVPTEHELCSRFSTSRITVRRALQILADEMLVVRRQGSGTFVSPTPSRKIPLLNTDFTGSLTQHAPDLTRRLDSWHWETANEEVASYLQTFAGSRVLFARRIDLLENVPVAYDEIYLPERVADRLTERDLEQLDFLHHWQEVQQIQIGHLTQSIEAVTAQERQAQHLSINTGLPLLKELDVMFLQIGSPCGFFISYYRHELFRLTSTVRLTSSSPTETTRLESTISNLVPTIG